MHKYMIRYTYYVEVDAPTSLEAGDIADEIFGADLEAGNLKAMDFIQSDPDWTDGLENHNE